MYKVMKYHNKWKTIDGIKFQSIREANRYLELKMLQKSHEIRNLRLQVPFVFFVDGKKVFTYIADFVYTTVGNSYGKLKGKKIIEDVKGYRTPIYKLKKKLIEAKLKIKIEEV